MYERLETEIIGQGGAAGHAPRNSESAIRDGLDRGATALALEVQFAADGVPVLFGDRSLEDRAGVRGRIRDQTARELAGYDIGFRSGNAHRGLRILTLEEALSLIPPETRIFLMIKDYDSVGTRHARDLAGILRRRREGADRCEIDAGSQKALSAIRSGAPEVRAGLRAGARSRRPVGQAESAGCSSLHVEPSEVDSSLASECRTRGLDLYTGPVDEIGRMKALLEIGVAGITTGFPERLAGLLGRSGKVKQSRPGTAAGGRPRVRARTSRPVESDPPPAPEEQAAARNEQPAGESSGPKKRRRGRRGGRRVRARREAARASDKSGD